MTFDELDTYLTRLTIELHKRGILDARSVEEARGHLVDATEQGIQRGLAADAAQREALARFGSAASVAANFASERYRWRDRLLFAVAVLVGLVTAYVDSRPHWDEPGRTALFMVVAAGVLGLVAPRRPWLWALAIGMWIPLDAFARSRSPQSIASVVVVAFPFVGAYAGMALRRTQAMLTARSGGHDGDFHDKAGQFHFLVKSKRGWVNPELVAIVADPSTKLVPFLERVTPRPLSPLGKPQSLTVVDDGRSSATGTEKYQAVFGDQKKITCTVAVDRSGKRVSVHWSRAHERESGS